MSRHTIILLDFTSFSGLTVVSNGITLKQTEAVISLVGRHLKIVEL